MSWQGRLSPPAAKSVWRENPVQGILPSVGYISQADTLLPWRTVLDNVALAMELRGVPKSQRQETAPGPDEKHGPGGL